MDDVFYYTAKDTGISEETIRYAYRQMWGSVRYYLNNPLESKSVIRLNQFMKFIILPGRIFHHKRLLSNKKNISKKQEEDIQYYETILKTHKYVKKGQIKQED